MLCKPPVRFLSFLLFKQHALIGIGFVSIAVDVGGFILGMKKKTRAHRNPVVVYFNSCASFTSFFFPLLSPSVMSLALFILSLHLSILHPYRATLSLSLTHSVQ
jgi:hypothetical protein